MSASIADFSRRISRRKRSIALTVCVLSLYAADALIAEQISAGTGDAGSRLLVMPAVPPLSVPQRTRRLEEILPESVPVTLHPAPFSLSPFIRCKLALTNVPMPRVRLALVPLDGEATAQLARLQTAYARIKLEVAYDTAPYQLSGPVVRGPPGYRRDVDIERSAADIARAAAGADGRARQAFEYFQSRSDARLATVPRQAEFTFRDLAPGRYAVCVMADVRSAAGARSIRTTPLIWWATALLSEREYAVVVFEQKQGRDWRELFSR